MAMFQELSQFVFKSHYAQRVEPGSDLLEEYAQSVHRVVAMHGRKYAKQLAASERLRKGFEATRRRMLRKLVLGSQRALQFGGKPIESHNARLYNCSATYIDRPRVFQETMWLLLCGVGVGFSVQRHHVGKLPPVFTPTGPEAHHKVEDSIEGWADAIGALMMSHFEEKGRGSRLVFNLDGLRPAGAPISNMTGTAPGPEPLRRAIAKIRAILEPVNGRRLKPIEAYDVLMVIADAVISGGIRRSACIAIFSPDDSEMAKAKTGDWFRTHPQRARSNNSMLLLRDELTSESLGLAFRQMREFGEPGVILADSREALYNPCVEIGLHGHGEEKGETGFEMCNLSEINVKGCGTAEQFYGACEAAAILGTMQAGYTDFGYLGAVTEGIVRHEALLGVSMTGIMDNPEIGLCPEVLRKGAALVLRTNAWVAEALGIRPAARATCVKPAGSTSCILGTASGIHPHHAPRYFRRVQANKREPAIRFLRKAMPDAVGHSVWSTGGTDDVATFLIEAGPGAVVKEDMPDLKLMAAVKLVFENWVKPGRAPERCRFPWLQHNVSNTINVGCGNWDKAMRFVLANRSSFSGLSFLSSTGDLDYPQAPMQRVLREEEIVKLYGACSLFASGLIVHAHSVFSGDLYAACSHLLRSSSSSNNTPDASGSIEEQRCALDKSLWAKRARKFADRHFGGDAKRLTYCLKHVDALKHWTDVERAYSKCKPIDWSELTLQEGDEERKTMVMACSGDTCEIVRI